jgi:hypothetical protein
VRQRSPKSLAEKSGPSLGLAVVVETGEGEPPFGWTFQVSHEARGGLLGDRLYESPHYVGIADQAQAQATLENYITPLEGTEIVLVSPISASMASGLGLRTNEIKQE